MFRVDVSHISNQSKLDHDDYPESWFPCSKEEEDEDDDEDEDEDAEALMIRINCPLRTGVMIYLINYHGYPILCQLKVLKLYPIQRMRMTRAKRRLRRRNPRRKAWFRRAACHGAACHQKEHEKSRKTFTTFVLYIWVYICSMFVYWTCVCVRRPLYSCSLKRPPTPRHHQESAPPPIRLGAISPLGG